MMKGSNIVPYELEGIQQTGSKPGWIKDKGDLNEIEDGEISDSNLNKQETSNSLLEELIFDANDAMPVNKKMSNTVKSSITDANVFGDLQQSETGEIENEEELRDLEEGEISESDNIKKNRKTVCRFFEHGTCFYGSRCQFLHVSDNVYNMFNPATSYKRSLEPIVPYFFPPEIENPVELEQYNKSAWEKGLENAKVMIQKAICKRVEDGDFENKKLYISSNSFTSEVSQDTDPNLKTNVKSMLDVSPNIEPLKANSLRFALHKTVNQKQGINTSNCYNVERSSFEYKWVDPWMRSKSPRKSCKSHRSSRYSRKEFNRALSSSSSSSIEHIYRGTESKKFYEKRSPTRKSNIKHSHRSYSRSFSRSLSRSSSRKRYQFHSSSWSRSASPVVRRTLKRKRPTSLEKWFKRQHRISSDSRSASSSSIISFRRSSRNISPKCNSDNESKSSITVSSITCSYCSSSSDSPKSQGNRSKSGVKKEFSNRNNFAISQNATEVNSLQSKKPLRSYCMKDKSLSSHASISASKRTENVSSSYKDTTSAKIAKTLVFANPSSPIISRDTAVQSVIPKSAPELPSKLPLNKAISKDNFSSTLNCLLRYRSLSDKRTSNQAAVSKPIIPTNKCTSNQASVSKSIIPTNKCTSNQAAVSKPIIPVVNSVPSSQAFHGVNSSQVPDNKKIFNCVSRRTITLNLQPKTQKHKVSEILNNKQDCPVTVCNLKKSTLNKKETLLKQLKLVEDAISRKKRC